MKRKKYDLVLIDFGHLVYRTLFASGEKESFDLWKAIIFNSLVSTVWKYKSSKVVLASEGPSNWRRDIYPAYKHARSKSRDESPIDFNKFFAVLSEYENSIKKNLPFIFMKIPHVEGDDIVGVLTTFYNKDKSILIVSADKDFQHLQILNNVKQWDPIKKKFIVCDNPKKFLLKMILMGDHGDNIPAIKPRLGERTAEKILNTYGLNGIRKYVQEEGLQKEFKRNLKLISLFHIDEKIKKQILQEFNNYKKPMLDLYTFLKENNLYKWQEDDKFTFVEQLFLEMY